MLQWKEINPHVMEGKSGRVSFFFMFKEKNKQNQVIFRLTSNLQGVASGCGEFPSPDEAKVAATVHFRSWLQLTNLKGN